MKTATVGEIQKSFVKVLKNIKAGEEIIVTKSGEPVAKITALGPKKNIDWPDFFEDAVEIKGKPVSEIVVEEREGFFTDAAWTTGVRAGGRSGRIKGYKR